MNGNILAPVGERFGLKACAMAGIMTASICLLTANWILDAQQERKAADEIERLDGRVHYAWRLDDKIKVASAKSDLAPGWLLPGDAFLSGVFLPNCHEESLDQKLACLKRLRNCAGSTCPMPGSRMRLSYMSQGSRVLSGSVCVSLRSRTKGCVNWNPRHA